MNRILDIDHGSPEFGGISFERESRAVLIAWFAETSLRNVVWARFIVIRLGWPLFGHYVGFIEDDQI